MEFVSGLTLQIVQIMAMLFIDVADIIIDGNDAQRKIQ